MGSGAVLLLLLVAGGYFLMKRLGAPSLFTTLLNPARARFTRHDVAESGTAVFDVTPARASWAIVLFCTVIFLAGYGLYRADQNTGHAGPLPFLIWVFVPVFGYFLLIGARDRKPARLTVSDQTLSTGARSWLLAEIASLQVRKGSRSGEREVGTIMTTDLATGITTGGRPTSALIAQAIGGRMAERSYLLTVRTRSSSEEHVLAGGLTPECAEALLHDLNERLR